MTNFEELKKELTEMSVDEMVKWLVKVVANEACDMCIYCRYDCMNELSFCEYGHRRWLKQEAEAHEENS